MLRTLLRRHLGDTVCPDGVGSNLLKPGRLRLHERENDPWLCVLESLLLKDPCARNQQRLHARFDEVNGDMRLIFLRTQQANRNFEHFGEVAWIAREIERLVSLTVESPRRDVDGILE